ncbi:MAG: hypothetical protein AMK69_23305 [Nitrospira bacterium SG8_3]|nr:MAG: hypothetical protein AMK69_23305 [Nitrospira bacterium SG8_3]
MFQPMLFHISIVPFPWLTASLREFLLNEILLTGAGWLRVLIALHESVFHIIVELSREPEASHCPLALHARDVISSVWLEISRSI